MYDYAFIPFLQKRAIVARGIAWFVIAATPLGLLNGVFLSHDVMPRAILVLCGAALLMLSPNGLAAGARFRFAGELRPFTELPSIFGFDPFLARSLCQPVAKVQAG